MPFQKLASLRWLVVLCLLTIALSGCGFLPNLGEFLPDLEAPPKVSFSNIQIEKTDSEYVVVVLLQVMNPNDVSFDIQSISCDLELNVNDETFVLEAATGAFTLESNSSVEVPVRIPGLSADMASDLTRMLWNCIVEGESATYALEGTLKSTLPLNFHGFPAEIPLKVSFSCTGSMQDKTIHYDLESALKVKVPFVPDPKLVKWSSSDDISTNELIGSLPIQLKTTNGTMIDILLPFTSPKGVGCDIQSISCGLSLNVKDKTFVLGAATTSAFTLEPNSSVEVPVRLPGLTADAVSNLAHILWSCIIEGEPAIYALEGTLTMKVPHLGPVDVPFSCTGPLQLSMKGNSIHYNLGSTLTVNVKPVVSAHVIPKWFEPNVYMTNKLHRLGDGWTWDRMIQEFNKAGYSGDEGYYRHFLDWGNHENVSPNKCFDAEYYFKSKLDRQQRVDPAGNWSLESIKKSFEKDGLSAWDHYTLYGMSEGIDPCSDFSTTKYLEAKLSSLQSTDPSWTRERMIRAFQAANLNPVAHYYVHGVDENLAYKPNCSKSK